MQRSMETITSLKELVHHSQNSLVTITFSRAASAFGTAAAPGPPSGLRTPASPHPSIMASASASYAQAPRRNLWGCNKKLGATNNQILKNHPKSKKNLNKPAAPNHALRPIWLFHAFPRLSQPNLARSRAKARWPHGHIWQTTPVVEISSPRRWGLTTGGSAGSFRATTRYQSNPFLDGDKNPETTTIQMLVVLYVL